MGHKYWMIGLPRYGILLINAIEGTDDSLMLELNCYPFKIFFRIENEMIAFGFGVFKYKIGLVFDKELESYE